MDDKDFMTLALQIADEAAAEGEVPVGAVIVRDGEVVGTGRNHRESHKNALSHAELEAIDNACKRLGGWRLFDCTMYVTLEPCPMCAGAILNARIDRVVFGAYDSKAGSVSSVQKMYDLPYNHKPEVEGGFMEEECAEKLKAFFKNMRNGIGKTPVNPNWKSRCAHK